MNNYEWEEYERFILDGRSAVWSDFERARHLRRMLRSSLARLDVLKCDPSRNAEFIMQEETALERTQMELARIESRLTMM